MSEERDLALQAPIPLKGIDIGEGDRDADSTVVDLYQRFRPALVSYSYRLLGSAADAEDLVQTAFLKVFDQLIGKAEIANLRSWLYRVVHNLAIDLVRRRGVEEWIVRAWRPEDSKSCRVPSVEEGLARRQRIERGLQQLSERERSCLLLRAEGLSYREIADVVGINVNAVGVYLDRGLKKFGREDDDR